MKGSAIVMQSEESLYLEKGQSILIKPNTAYKIKTDAEVEIYKAGVPK